MEIKKYFDKVREYIKIIEKDYDYTMSRPAISREDSQRSNEYCKYLSGKKAGLNEALNILTDLVKEDL